MGGRLPFIRSLEAPYYGLAFDEIHLSSFKKNIRIYHCGCLTYRWEDAKLHSIETDMKDALEVKHFRGMFRMSLKFSYKLLTVLKNN